MKIRRMLAVLALILALPARATDLTDLWWNPSESGWGVTATHQGNVVFLTFFIYGQNGQPLWLSGAAFFARNDTAGNPVYTGTLHQNTGPWFATSFNPTLVTANPVGSATFTVTSVSSATLAYSVNGVQVSKALVRQAFALNNVVNGNYFGGFIGDTTGCPVPASNGHFEAEVLVGVSGTTANTQVVLQGSNGSCTFRGPYTQAGRMGRIEGSVVCTFGTSGTVTIFEIEANNSALSARYSGSYTNGCRETGHFGGVRR
jgi:hypothetical protein